MGKGTRKGTRQVRMADDTKRKSAVTCLSRTLPSSSNAPNSHESAACLPWMSRTVLDPDPNWAPLSNTPAHSLSPLFYILKQPPTPSHTSTTEIFIRGTRSHYRPKLQSPCPWGVESHIPMAPESSAILALVGTLIRVTAEPVT